MTAACRACGGTSLEHVLSLGKTPLAKALLTKDDLEKPEPTFPLDLVFCKACTLVQITEDVTANTMVAEELSASASLVNVAEKTASKLIADEKLDSKSLVIEISSNDGYLLQHYAKAGISVLGIEAVKNVADAAEKKGIPTLNTSFSLELAKELVGTAKARLLHASNVLSHVADLRGTVAGFNTLLADDGLAVVEVPYVRDFVEQCEFDRVYHEHLSYFSLTSIEKLFAKVGLVVHDVEKTPAWGGSLRLYVSKGRKKHKRVGAMLSEEKSAGMGEIGFYASLANRVTALKKEITALLMDRKAKGARIAAYGAAAKGATLLNFLGIDRGTIDFVVDRSTEKQGRFMPGAHIPILSPEALFDKSPDYCLVLARNFTDEILAQQTEYRENGGKFIVPLPSVKIV